MTTQQNKWYILRKALAGAVLAVAAVSLLAACGAKADKPAAGSPKEQKIVRIGTNGAFYPYTFKNTENGDKLEGYEIEIWENIAEKLNFKIEYQLTDFASLFGALESKKIDTIVNSIALSEERKAKYLFTDPYVYSGAQLVVQKDNKTVNSLEDLKGKKIGVVAGNKIMLNYIKEADPEGKIEVVIYETGEGAFRDVLLGRLDATFSTKAAALAQIKKTGQPLRLAGSQFVVIPAGSPFLITDDNKAFVEEVNATLEELRKDGTIKKIAEKWYGEDISKPAE
ncbi:transporter substrate-binding domain-containing protein [Paenibacillus radicis (ex Gao et al. 2016)]|uniref:Amino-acid-binding protein YxeM n=1 Tax=Paenibacillus radicis (ex Gao et al. 2016) TaxID=1737354 RepID=A0A917H2V5_9BACL|nr:transporter substrate-binding domain-containing protein [Paenibacillus radicis (ex Gao et al. 2016)]GGG65664.1 putative amino-acid-binding protein YxeM [Paenibacillus radicis (ex Gao et al. 2016)]